MKVSGHHPHLTIASRPASNGSARNRTLLAGSRAIVLAFCLHQPRPLFHLVRKENPSMPLVSMRQLLDEAAKGGYGVGAFNVNNMEQIQSIMEAARETQSPVIVQASRGARAYSQDRFLYHLMVAATELYPEIPTVLHLDHGNSPETCKSAINMGFTSVMMDGSLMADGKTPSSFEYNVKVTREVVELAHAKGVTVEGEIGCLGGIEDGHGAGGDGLAHLTDPAQAAEFVEKTCVDALAIAIGTSHGAYKFSSKPTGDTLKMDVLIAIHKLL